MNQEQFFTACYNTATLLLVSCDVDGYGPESEPERCLEDPTCVKHCLWMLDEANKFYQQDKAEKANRWLGFVQGVIAARDLATLDQLKEANMPPTDTFDRNRI